MRFLLLTLPVQILKLTLTALVFVTPILGVWLASSLVAYTNGPVWLAIFSGILLFPTIPIVWDMWGHRKRKTPGILTWGDRITLRTLALNLAFIACLLALRPQTSFLALSTRGDWMLDGRQGQLVEVGRQSLFKLANGLEWLYLAFHNNPFEQYADTKQVQPSIQSNTSSTTASQAVSVDQSTSSASPQGSKQWPWKGVGLHPVVASMPPSVETSIESVAQYIAQKEKDPFLRVKALHDYAADRVSYDVQSYLTNQYPPQEAEAVFQRRTAVCAGYAKLLEALGKAAGEEIVYVVGDARTQNSDLSGQGHAWNAAKIQGNWYLLDATWDSGGVDGSTFTKKYRTSYLFPPPEAMVISHFPDDDAWQLLPVPITRGDFLRQPMLRPEFFAEELTLVFPTRSQTDTQGSALIQFENPNKVQVSATYGAKGSEQNQHCVDQTAQENQISCPLPVSGTYEVNLFSSGMQTGDYQYLGQLEFNNS